MKDMTIIENKKIVNKETNEVRKVVEIDEVNRKIFSVPVDEPDAEPTCMAAATYDRRWGLYEEPETETAAEPETEESKTETAAEDKPEPMKMSETITALENIFDKLNALYFEGALPRPVITVQTTPKAYGHCSTKKIWKSENEGMYEINLGAEFINRPKESTCATLLHEMVHLYCTENELADTCQNGRYHNKTFKAECEARDLAVEYDRANGYAHTAPTDAFKAKLAEAGIDLSVRFARIMQKTKAKAEREKAHRYVCPICGQEVRTTAELSLICGHCNVNMDRLD
nr:MAG TPA: SprT-like family [Bacteriophage sp.]